MSTPDDFGLFDLERLRAEVGLTERQARWMLAHAEHTGQVGRPVIVGADAVEMLLREMPADLRDREENAP
jgi:hypothetical protein